MKTSDCIILNRLISYCQPRDAIDGVCPSLGIVFTSELLYQTPEIEDLALLDSAVVVRITPN